MSTLDTTAQLLGQLTWHWDHQARARLEGLSDEEYLWEPVPGAWNVRERATAADQELLALSGTGPVGIDFAFPTPDPEPLTTIAWRLAHINIGIFGARNASHFGGPPISYETATYTLSAAEALAELDAHYARWVDGVRGLTEEDLARPVGPAEGGFAEHPMIELVLHINREAIHHLAEIALLRDLWAHGVR